MSKKDTGENNDVEAVDITLDYYNLPRPADGGYGWVIAVASLYMSLAETVVMTGFSVLYTPYVETFQTSRADTAWITSLQMFTSCFTSVVSGCLVERFGCRYLCLFGSLMSTVGFIISSFASNIYTLYLTNALLAGPGLGFVALCSVVIIQQWFDKKRPLATSMHAFGRDVGNLITGPLTSVLNLTYGWRGALLFHGGIILNISVGAMLLRPAFYSRKDSIPLQDFQLHPIKKEQSKRKGKEKYCQNCEIDFSLWKSPSILVLGIGTLLMNIGVQTLRYHSPSRALYKRIDEERARFLPSVYGISSMFGCIAGGILGTAKFANIFMQYSLSILVGGVITCLFGLTDSFVLQVVCMAPASFLAGVYFSVQSALVAELVGVSRVPQASGALFFFIGIASLTAVPFSGWLYDISQNYDIPFFVTGAMQGFGGVLLLFLPYRHHLRRTRLHRQRINNC